MLDFHRLYDACVVTKEKYIEGNYAVPIKQLNRAFEVIVPMIVIYLIAHNVLYAVVGAFSCELIEISICVVEALYMVITEYRNLGKDSQQ